MAATTSVPTARARLGIPEDARRVLVITESSHWDPDWLLTADQYFRWRVRRTLDLVLDELARDPRRVWSADCVFFLAMYWDRRPARREELAAALDSGRLRLTASGVTSPDTLLPPTEALVRDLLVGQEWLRARGIGQEPRLAYFPDSFGHSPCLPSLLRATGFDRALVTRIDGAYFEGTDWEPRSAFPRPGSTAARLTEEGSADFVWCDPSGAGVLAHWHPFTYGQGDLLAARGVTRWMGVPAAVPDRSERHVARRIDGFVRRLEPLARTPYLLCPIGFDFVHPIPDLLALLDRHNRVRYPSTGTWVLNAGADDYLDLVAEHGADLPRVEADPNPYWTGFYASRPELKRAHRQLVDELVATEAEAVARGPVAAARTSAALRAPWWSAVVGNHHDFITGTAPDRVVRAEQEPWLASSLAAVRRVAGAPAATVPTPEDGGPSVHWSWDDERLTVTAGDLVAVVDPGRGGAITSVELGGTTVLTGAGADLVAHDDSGGLWRMGHEYRGGHLTEVDRTSRRRALVEVEDPDGGGGPTVVVRASLDGRPTVRRYRFSAEPPAVVVEVGSSAGDRRTVTLQAPLPGPAERLVMDQPGGVVTRPPHRQYSPTFWPVSSWAVIDPAGAHRPAALGVELARAVAVRDTRTAEVVVARNATRERAWGWLPIPACPATGHEPGPTEATVALWWPADGGGDLPARAAAAQRVARALTVGDTRRRLEAAAASVVAAVDRPEIEVIACKPADRGEGLVVRLADRSGVGAGAVTLSLVTPVASAARCDGRERDLAPLEIDRSDDGHRVTVPLAGTIASVRLVPAAWAD